MNDGDSMNERRIRKRSSAPGLRQNSDRYSSNKNVVSDQPVGNAPEIPSTQTNLPQLLHSMMNSPNYETFSHLRALAAADICALAASCINPLGPIGKRPQPPPARSSPPLSQKFAWKISTSSYQYEDPDVRQGDQDYFYSDWDILIGRRKAPLEGNALYSWTQFEKDLAL
jgi:hypothetical protein